MEKTIWTILPNHIICSQHTVRIAIVKKFTKKYEIQRRYIIDQEEHFPEKIRSISSPVLEIGNFTKFYRFFKSYRGQSVNINQFACFHQHVFVEQEKLGRLGFKIFFQLKFYVCKNRNIVIIFDQNCQKLPVFRI